ncbi:MAG TPA: hypothetical protein VGQ56_09920 [Gemmatimonadaceae bacterium]|nr:hypothetical protein [Gemmatimonadaceae bacterium]
MDTAAPDSTVRWKSVSGIGLALLLIYGLINLGAAIDVPMTLEAKGGQGGGSAGVIMAQAPEEFMLGTTYAQLHQDNPKLDKLLVDSMVGMCSMMMGMAIAFLGIAWFAARRGARWAPWVLLVSGVIWVPYYFVIASDLAAFGAKATFASAAMISLFAVPALLGAVLMLVAPKQAMSERT